MLKEEKTIIEAVKKICPAVVSIIVTKHLPKVKQSFFPIFGPFGFLIPGESEENQKGKKESEDIQVSGGSGFIIYSNDSYSLILTNKHVVYDPDAEYTVIIDDKEYPAIILSRDPIDDIAILKIEIGNLPQAKLGDSSKIEIGQTVIAIGTALGMFTNTVSKGIISGLSRKIVASLGGGEETETLRGVIQTDVAINQGNSGGPLINSEGEVIGINTAVIFGAQNIGFAIPINWAKRDLNDILKYGKIMRPYLGLRYIMLNKKIKEKYNLDIDHGALIARDHLPNSQAVVPQSPAEKAGIKENDIILEIGGKKLDEKSELADILQEFSVGNEIEIVLLRNGKEIRTKAKLEERK